MDLLGNIPDKSLHSTNTQKRSWLTFKETALSTDMPGMIEAPDLGKIVRGLFQIINNVKKNNDLKSSRLWPPLSPYTQVWAVFSIVQYFCSILLKYISWKEIKGYFKHLCNTSNQVKQMSEHGFICLFKSSFQLLILSALAEFLYRKVIWQQAYLEIFLSHCFPHQA